MADDAKVALHEHKADIEAAIRALLAEVLSWPEQFPRELRLCRLLASYVTARGGRAVPSLSERLALLLAAWAEPFIGRGLVIPLSSTQLYALILAPALSASVDAGATFAKAESGIDWLELLSLNAIRAIQVPADKVKRRSPSPSQTVPNQASLFPDGSR